MYLFRKTGELPDMDFPAVIQYGAAGKAAKYLVLIRAKELQIDFCATVQDGGKVHFKAPVVTGEFPGS